MSVLAVKELSKKINQLEKLVRLHIQQEQEKDWLDQPKLVKKLDQLASQEESLPASAPKF